MSLHTRLVALLRRIGHLDSHVRQIVAIIVALVSFLFFHQHEVSIITHFIAIWDVYAFVVVLMAWITICTGNPRNIQWRVRLQDSSRALIFTFVIVAACISGKVRDNGEADVSEVNSRLDLAPDAAFDREIAKVLTSMTTRSRVLV